MLGNKGFDLWADGYDRAVGLSDDDETYPFAGYKDVLNAIYNAILMNGKGTVLDIGFGTGNLSAKLYEQGCIIHGQDFSRRMLEISQRKMPDAKLYCGDFSQQLAAPLVQNKYDAIIATYSLHHLTDTRKVAFIASLLPLLSDDGCIYIGDVAFTTRDALMSCKASAGDEWDNDEYYFVFEDLLDAFPKMTFDIKSFCSAVLTLRKEPI